MSFDASRFVNFRPDPGSPHLNPVDVVIVCKVHHFRAKPLITLAAEKRQPASVLVNGQPPAIDPDRGTFSARCGAENQRGQCRISTTLNLQALITLADYLRFDQVILTTQEVEALINRPDQARRYWIMREYPR